MITDTIIHDDITSFCFQSSLTEKACGYNFHTDEQIISRKQSLNIYSFASNNRVAENEPKLNKYQSESTSHNLQINYHSNETALQQLYSNIEKAYNDHLIDEAYKLALNYQKICKASQRQLSESESKYLKNIYNEMQDVLHYENIINQEGWQVQKQKKNLKVSTKIDQNTVGVLIEAQLDIPIEHFLSVLIQIDLMKNYMPFMEHSKQEKIVSRNCRIGHSINNFPILSKREAFFQGIGYDRMDHNKTVILYSRSLNDRPDLQQLLGYQVQPTKGAVQLDYRYLVMQYRPTTPIKGSLKMALNIDLKLRLPMWILMPATQNFGVDFYKNILKIAKEFKGSAWQTRAKENPAFFNLVHRRIQQLFKQVPDSLKE